ncbi:hypothetical protein CRG98_020237 [Punica granatum]|uniref:Uncharacterized protein n=1 Tax=Punica granatum TaxID=22663 RepID=A0A2I0JSS5_PUNGR|nr:hypothetical protein CRG98_020237 [Punica granatum]
MGIKLGRMEGPAGKGEGESSRKTIAEASSMRGRKGKEMAVNVINPGHLGAQPYSVNFTPTPPSTPVYAPPPGHYQPPHHAQPIYYSTPLTSFSSPALSQAVHHYTPPPHQTQQYRSPTLLTGNKIIPVALAPSYNPTAQNQDLRCEYHQGALGHIADNCWKLRDKIQDMIDENKITFNAMKLPNVQTNPLPNHASSSGSAINLVNHSGKYDLCGPQSRSNHSGVAMTGLPKLSVPHVRHPMGRSLDKRGFLMGPLYISYHTIHCDNRLMQHFLCRPSQGHAGHRRRTMHGFTSPRELCRALYLLLQQGKGLIKRYPLRSQRQRRSSKPFNMNASVSIEIERRLETNWATTTTEAH